MPSKLGSYTVTNATRLVVAEDNISYLSITYISGTVTVLCQGKTIASWGSNNEIALSSTLKTINVQDTVNIQPLDGITINASSGVFAAIVG
jgi:hypothetical protein